MRKAIAKKTKRIILAIGRLPGLTQEQLGSTLALGVAGVLGYYARSTPMDLMTCKSIEEARIKVLRAAGYATGAPRGQIYHAGSEGGKETHEHAYGIATAAYCDQIDRALCGPPERTDHIQRNVTTRMEPDTPAGEAGRNTNDGGILKYKLILGINGIQTNGTLHEALSGKKWGTTPRTPRLWEKDKLVTAERKIATKPITFHRALAEMSIAEWADIYDTTTKEYYTMGGLCKKYGAKKNTRIMQEYSNVKRLHNKLLQETEQGALGIIWGRHKDELLVAQGGKEQLSRVSGVREKMKKAGCWGGKNT
eukprot:6191583-Pleurochrysis_carterae.AAC.5